MKTYKFLIRKISFVLVLAILVTTPFAVVRYKSLTTTDPYILMARQIEAFDEGDVDVVTTEDHPNLDNGLTVIVNIPDYTKWSERIKENFLRLVMDTARAYNYDDLVIVIGWGAPVETMLIQRAIKCVNLTVVRANACSEEAVPGAKIPSEYIKWPGIGNP